MSVESALAELATFLAVLKEDEDLRAWFESLTHDSAEARQAALLRIVAEMQAAGESEELIRATALLAEPDVFNAARRALENAPRTLVG